MRKFILGTDWWDDCDDVMAVRLLTRAIRNGEAQLLGVGINACMEYSVASLKGFLNADKVFDIPIGIDLEADDFGGQPSYQKRLAETFGAGIHTKHISITNMFCILITLFQVANNFMNIIITFNMKSHGNES